MNMTSAPALQEGQTRTSPSPVGRCTPRVSSSRAKTQETPSPWPVRKVACTAYGSARS